MPTIDQELVQKEKENHALRDELEKMYLKNTLLIFALTLAIAGCVALMAVLSLVEKL